MKSGLLRKAVLCCVFVIVSIAMTAQLTINNAVNAVDGVQNVLLGAGITATNISFIGSNDQIASFNGTNSNLGIGSGLVLSTGNANNAIGPNNFESTTTNYSSNYYDSDLDAISAVTVQDACILQFDFIPQGNNLAFNFVFASEEYPEYINDLFNDSFGFFLSGPGITGPYQNQAMNVALIPGTSVPVSINNLNNGYDGVSGPCEYCSNYIHNGDGYESPFNSSNYFIQADGFTTVLQATATVQCGQTYHIKLAIGDGYDNLYDSWVFLAGGSFASNALDLSFTPTTVSPSNTGLYEGCNGSTVTFPRPPGVTGDVVFDVAVSGTAVNGIDYQTIPSTVFLPNGINSVTVPVNGIIDGITEGQETIVLTVSHAGTCSASATLNLVIEELAPIIVTSPDLTLACTDPGQINLAITGGYGQYIIEWDGTPGESSLDIPHEQAIYYYTVGDVCGTPDVSGSVAVDLVQYNPMTVSLPAQVSGTCLTPLQINPTGVSGGDGNYSYQWSVDGSPFSYSPVFNWSTPTPSTVTVVVTDGCGTTATASSTISIPPTPITVTLGQDIQSTCFATVNVNVVSVTGGSGTYNYAWTYNGDPAGNSSSISFVASGGGPVQLTVTDQCGNSDSDELIVNVPPNPITINLPPTQSVQCMTNFTLSPSVSGGAGTYTYSWTVSQSVLGAGATLTTSTMEDMQITFTVNDQCGNSATDVIAIQVVDSPINLVVSPDAFICPGGSTILSVQATGGIGNYNYTWSNGSQTSSQINVAPLSTSTYVTTVSDICGNSATEDITVNVYTQLAPFYVHDTTICAAFSSGELGFGGFPPYNFYYNSDSLLYFPGEGFTGLALGSSLVMIEDQCGGSGSLIITVSPCETLIPNVFTPFNNDGENDTFEIAGLLPYFKNSALHVYNRWGGLVYENDNYDNKWKADDLVDGTYFYIFERSDGEKFSGNVTILQ